MSKTATRTSAERGYEDVLERALNGERLTREDGVALQNAPLTRLGEVADELRARRAGDTVTFIKDRNVNYTNVCDTYCSFCAFYRKPGHDEGYVLSRDELYEKIQETVDAGGVQILMQGGVHPDLDLEWFEEMLSDVKERFDIHMHAFSPEEINDLARKENLSYREVLRRLRDAGLDSIPGGGGEILADRVRDEISPYKVTKTEWLGVMRAAHDLGLSTTATMMYGTVETWDERIDHLLRLRDLQDETGGFMAFICWDFQPGDTPLARKTGPKGPSATDYLRTLAVARIMLDNFENFQSSWVTQGAKVGQMALAYGANDMGSTMMEENVVAEAGADFRMTEDEIVRAIEDAGRPAALRDQRYDVLQEY
ncbi:MAG: cyclic dehypoxanthinyl futalosine synthase [Methanobacteriota archaeon]|jgi:cyclic dehypoxanthinyl futalosine synthase|uniref:Cyclic dehypoxanthine futalosine synthase n=1 Tax=Halorutilus salinus TaxID=2487751 RepID=A0A9Q4GFN3_9EURY|nr:cyclic dehypoxanthinyl futalosine synthase [Halorutilus salinus]MCX2818329.1 dehypoxanthine futalosine cyclase [Halorutilus salinus]